jgi:Ca-activated chloride channel family protein
MFTWPALLLSLLLVPLLAALYVLVLSRRRRYYLRYSSVGLVAPAVHRGAAFRRHAPAVFYLLALAAMAIGLARPYATVPNPQATGTVILVIDASRSMLAADIAPTRIDAARVAIRNFTSKQPKGIRIGVVAFSGAAWLIVPPTTDRKQVNGAVNYLTLGRGTNIGDGLQVALETIVSPMDLETPPYTTETTRRPFVAPANPRESVVVLLSDGASTVGPDPIAVASELGKAGVRVHTVGLGTPQGDPTMGFGGARILDEYTLKGIAEETGGKYYTARSASQLHEVYGQLATHDELVTERTELTFLVVAAGLLFSITGGVLGFVWGPRLP